MKLAAILYRVFGKKGDENKFIYGAILIGKINKQTLVEQMQGDDVTQ